MTTTEVSAHVVASSGSTDPTAPLVVLLHGRGSHEGEILGLADHLPAGPAYSAVRAPVAESLRQEMDWFRSWLDDVASEGRPVFLIGFSGGAAFAGGLLLDDPSRFAGAAILYGTLPFGAGVPTTPGRLAGIPVFVAQGEEDIVIPRPLLDATWRYLREESGARTIAVRQPGGHGLTAEAVHHLSSWLGEMLATVSRGDTAAT